MAATDADKSVHNSDDRSRWNPLRHPRARVRPGIELPPISRFSHCRIHLRPSRAHKKFGQQFAITDSVDKTVGLYSIRNERIAVAHRTSDSAFPADPRAVVQTTYSDLGWLVPDALAHCPDPPALYYDQVSQIEMPRWTTDRVALVGDACQAVSLLAGQGASLAVAGAQLVASELANEANVTDALSHYTRRMAVSVADKQAAARRTAEWFLPSTPRRLPLRRLALRGMALPGLGRLISSRLVAGSCGIP